MVKVMDNKKLKKRVIEAWTNPKFPGAFLGLQPFYRHFLKVYHFNPKPSLNQIGSILKNNLLYASNIHKPIKVKWRPSVHLGVGIQATADILQINIANKFNWNILAVLDFTSKFMYADFVENSNPKTLRLAFNRLFNNGMPFFAKIVHDGDKSFVKLKKYFLSRDIYAVPRKSAYKLASAEGSFRKLKTFIHRYLQSHPNIKNTLIEKRYSKTGRRFLKQILNDAVNNFTSTINSHGFIQIGRAHV